jgi:hypothetical protein
LMRAKFCWRLGTPKVAFNKTSPFDQAHMHAQIMHSHSQHMFVRHSLTHVPGLSCAGQAVHALMRAKLCWRLGTPRLALNSTSPFDKAHMHAQLMHANSQLLFVKHSLPHMPGLSSAGQAVHALVRAKFCSRLS